MRAGHQSDADIYIYDEIGFWGVTAKQFISDLNALGDITHINLHINSPGGDVFVTGSFKPSGLFPPALQK
ncbi:ATP-dependent Clp protease proteolytic subunit domain protein [Escherichia coli DEC1E]|nr:ATP-dependent Clp protease proteolytic subunit domain protein [Escherichia coli DEC1E]